MCGYRTAVPEDAYVHVNDYSGKIQHFALAQQCMYDGSVYLMMY